MQARYYSRHMAVSGALALLVVLLASVTAVANNTAPIAYICSSSLDGFSHNYGLSAIDLRNFNYTTLFSGQSPPSYLAISPDGLWLYAVHEQSCGITKIDIGNRSAVKTIPVDMYPQDVAISPDGKRIYISCAQPYAGDTVCVVDAVSFEVIDRLRPGISPGRLAISGDGSRIYVLPARYSQSQYTNGRLTTSGPVVLDAFSGAILGRLNAGEQPSGMAFADGGNRLYVACEGSDNVTVIDLATGDQSDSIRAMRSPADVVADPGDKNVFVVNSYYGSSFLSIINTTTDLISGTVDLRAYPDVIQEYELPLKTAVVSDDGRKVYVANPDADSVSVVDVESLRLDANIAVGMLPTGLCLSGDGRTLYVACQGSGSVLAINTTDNRVSGTIYQGMSPWDVAFFPDGSCALIVNGNTDVLSVVDTATGALLKTVKVSGTPISVAVSPSDDLAYVAITSNKSIDVVDIVRGSVVAGVKVDMTPVDLAVSRDGSEVFMMMDNLGTGSGEGDTSVGVLDAGSLKMTRTAKIGRYGGAIDLSPDGKRIYATLWQSNTVLALDSATLSVMGRINGDVSPGDVKASVDGLTVYVADTGGMSLLSIDADLNTVKGRVKLSIPPQHLALSRDGSLACLSSRDGVAVVDLANNSIIATLRIPDSRGIAVNPAADLPLRVIATTPANMSSTYIDDAVIEVRFSRPVNISTVNASSFEVKAYGGGIIPGNISFSGDSRVASFRPSVGLNRSMTYVGHVTGAVEDQAGGRLAGDYEWTFGASEFRQEEVPVSFFIYVSPFIAGFILLCIVAAIYLLLRRRRKR
jgi:YVTN family beta-propeller protein